MKERRLRFDDEIAIQQLSHVLLERLFPSGERSCPLRQYPSLSDLRNFSDRRSASRYYCSQSSPQVPKYAPNGKQQQESICDILNICPEHVIVSQNSKVALSSPRSNKRFEVKS